MCAWYCQSYGFDLGLVCWCADKCVCGIANLWFGLCLVFAVSMRQINVCGTVNSMFWFGFGVCCVGVLINVCNIVGVNYFICCIIICIQDKILFLVPCCDFGCFWHKKFEKMGVFCEKMADFCGFLVFFVLVGRKVGVLCPALSW